MKLILFPHNLGSQGATQLAEEFETIKVKPDGKYTPKSHHVILNWGNSQAPNWGAAAKQVGAKILNHWDNIKVSCNKKTAFEKLLAGQVVVPEFTNEVQVAQSWIGAGSWVVCRNILNGSQGDGIVICKTSQELTAAAPAAKLFVKYFKRKHEYRVFVGNGKVIDFIQKKKKGDFQGEHNNEVRNLNGGWIFAREGVQLPDVVKNEAIKAAKVLKLDFAGIDIGFNQTENKAAVFEANTAVGITPEGTTLDKISEFLKTYLNPQMGVANAQAQVEAVQPEVVVPAAQVPAPAPVVKKSFVPPAQVNKQKNRFSVSFEGVSNIECQPEDDGTVTFFGKVAGVPKPIKLSQFKNGKQVWHFQDEE